MLILFLVSPLADAAAGRGSKKAFLGTHEHDWGYIHKQPIRTAVRITCRWGYVICTVGMQYSPERRLVLPDWRVSIRGGRPVVLQGRLPAEQHTEANRGHGMHRSEQCNNYRWVGLHNVGIR